MDPNIVNPKLLILFIILIVLGTLGYFLIPSFVSYLPFIKSGTSTEVKPKLVKESNTFEEAINSHPSIYFVNLEYDPKSGLVMQKNSGTGNSDRPILDVDQPKNLPNYFTYKLEVKSEKDELLQSGWVQLPLKILLTKQNTLELRINTIYQKNAIITVSIPQDNQNSQSNLKVLWKGKII